MKVMLILAALSAVVAAEFSSYEGYKVYQIEPKTQHQIDTIRIFNRYPYFDFWSQPKVIGLPVTIMVAPEAQDGFTRILNANKIDYEVLIENVERNVIEERARQFVSPKIDKGRISFRKYHQYDEIQDYLVALAENYPQIVSLENIGTSYEGRDLSMVKIGTGGGDKPIILVDGGIHAREWISPAFVVYLIHQLVENEDNRDMIENIDWYIIPVINPDGYEYTHTNARLWRKTRSTGATCPGVDGNRNFGFHWMETGASSSECSEIYAGPYEFSENETSALKNVVEENKDLIKLYLTFHSYGNFILYPWGYTSSLPDDARELHALGIQVEAGIASVAGTRYTIGSSTNVLYAAAGGSDDWVKGVGGVELSYTIELPGGGSWGFDLPASKILDVCVETFKGVKVYHSYIEQKFSRLYNHSE